jgi:hypothetical protein
MGLLSRGTGEDMQVEYERTAFRGDTVTEQDSIHWWIESSLKKGGIESQVQKLRNLLAIVGEHWLVANPQRVDDVATAIECEGYRHKITHSES